ncbi:tripartite motif-containing protein 35 isoform X2 [Myripristis murdjan]|uniref:tripartite motif-containing protein 35 isoform X2 n=1 Tax=Myripristis murdjan TaxID=586833 RepID=UPI001175DAC1|nr:tripartite motif-containing protein 35-like isoform X2 [Myripristis murdjan]
MSLPEEDLTCPICCDIFIDPVLLSCSHSFCRGCLKRCWKTSGLRECPVCRKKVSKSCPLSNLALKNLCEALLQTRSQSSVPVEETMNCNLHRERFKLFCLVDKQPICVVCQSSKMHKSHDCSPIEEAVVDCKDELTLSHKSLEDKLERLKRICRTSVDMLDYIKSQALETQILIKKQFEQLHQVLYNEESARLAAVRKEEEEKMAGVKDKIKEISAEILSLTETIIVLKEELKEDDLVLLKNYKATLERAKSAQLDSEYMSGVLMDVTSHLCNLKYRVWEKMLDHVEYTPVTLDPNTAHPCLILSDDFTSLHYSSQPRHCPDNPERFHISAEVVGMTALGSGSHHWIVETGSNQDWLLGVVSLSVPRNAEVSARPENGFWTLCFRDGEFRAMTSPPTPFTVSKTPNQVKVQLDFDKGTLSFLDSVDDTLLYEFTHTFTETLLPYFYTQSQHPLKILPENVFATVLRK